jgi:DNA-binding response OmpR family regulator
LEILIVDDERDLLESLRRGLNCLHYKTREVTSADAAVEVLKAPSPIDLVITDHAMPGMTGMELVEWIRREKAGLPVIVMTAFGDKEMVIRTLKNPKSGYIEKPFTLKELTAEITRVTTDSGASNHPGNDAFRHLARRMNDPLLAIMGSARISLEADGDRLSRSSQQRLRDIIDAAQRIHAINRNLMALGKAKEGQ